MKKKYVLKIIILFIIAILVPLISKAESIQGVKFEVPKGYQKISDDKNMALFMNTNTNSTISLIILKKDKDNKKAFEMDTEEIAQVFSAVYDNTKSFKTISGVQEVKLGKEKGKSFRVEIKTKPKMYAEYNIIKTKDRIVMLYMGAYDKKSLDSEEFNNLKQSIKINKIFSPIAILIIVIPILIIIVILFIIKNRRTRKPQETVDITQDMW